MKLSLSEISTVDASFAEDVVAYAAAGFDAIGLWEFKLPPDDEANIALLREHGLTVANCVPTVPAILQLGIPGMEGPADPGERVDAICASVRRLAAYEPGCVLCLSGPLGGRSVDDGWAIVADGLRRVASAARESGVQLGFEPIHAAQALTTGFVNLTEDALQLLEEADALDVGGVMADTYNLAAEDPAELAMIASWIKGLHVADWPAGEGRDDRVLPGAGRGEAARFVAALRAAGWDGTLDVEIFSTPDRFWALPVDEAARRAHAAATALRDAS